MAATTAPRTTPAATLLAIVGLLMAAGYQPRTSLQPYRGAWEVGFYSHLGVAAYHGSVRVGVRSGKVLGGVIWPWGEDGPRREYRTAKDLHDALLAVPYVADEHAVAAAATDKPYTPQPNELVLYHGSKEQCHGVWRVRGLIEHGPYVGRTLLVDPHNHRETLIVSAGNRSISPLPAA